MTHDIDQITDSFAAHEHLAPDAESVLARARVIARSYQRRRWAVRATGGAVLAGGIVAGGIALPGAGHSATDGQTIAAAVAPTTSASPTASSTYTQAQEENEYFAKGYDLTNAQALSTLWNVSDLTQVKTKAGLELLEGQTLPVTPENVAPPTSSATSSDIDAFFRAGYQYNDAVHLASLWNLKGSYQAKIKGGKELLAGDTLPIPPSGPPTAAGTTLVVGSSGAAKKAIMAKAQALRAAAGSSVSSSASSDDGMSPALQAYFDAGYDYNDAVALGKVWNETDISSIKTEAGQKLIGGQTLPVAPSGTPATPEDKNVEAFFNAGYDYNDAVQLGKLWKISDTYQVKIDAGKKLSEGQTLPIAP
jgi:hypothetical protein